jgi:hypothetical protein
MHSLDFGIGLNLIGIAHQTIERYVLRVHTTPLGGRPVQQAART